MNSCENALVALAAVVAQLELMLRESRAPVRSLTDALECVAGPGSGGALRPEIAQCFKSLQFYDRLTQHLSHLLEFLSEMRDAGSPTIVQDEASSVVWGMPGAAVELGAASQILPLATISTQSRAPAAVMDAPRHCRCRRIAAAVRAGAGPASRRLVFEAIGRCRT